MPYHLQLKASWSLAIKPVGSHCLRASALRHAILSATIQHNSRRRLQTTAAVAAAKDDIIGSNNEDTVIRWFGSKNDGQARLRYVSAFTRIEQSGMDKQIGLFEMHKERQAEMLVQDFKHMLKLLEDATVADAEGSKSVREQKDSWEEQDIMDDMALEQLAGVIDDITYASSQTPAPLRLEFARNSGSSRRERLRGRPDRWTSLSFSTYVDDLIESTTTAAQQHTEAVSVELVSVLCDESILPWMKSKALDRSLVFLFRNRKLDAINQIYLHIKDRSHLFTTTTFDTLLSVAGTHPSGRDFQSLLRAMLRNKLQPTIKTWSLFYQLVCRKFPHRVRLVSRAMRRKGLLSDARLVEQVVAHAVDGGLPRHLNSGGSVENFLKEFEGLYGERSKWLGRSVGNRMCWVVLEKGMVGDALDLVKQIQLSAPGKEQAVLRPSTVNTFLATTLRNRELGTALGHLRRLQSILASQNGDAAQAVGLQLNHVTFGLLFRLAWRCRCFNVLRVVWRYACVSGNTNRAMQECMRNNLEIPRPFEGRDAVRSPSEDLRENAGVEWMARMSSDGLWHVWAPRFAIGAQEGLSQPSSPTEAPTLLSKHGQKLVTLATAPQRAKGWRRVKESIERLRAVFDEDLEAARCMHPTVDISDCLERAWKKDCEWKEHGLAVRRSWGETEVFVDMWKRGAHVPMEIVDGKAGVPVRTVTVKDSIKKQ